MDKDIRNCKIKSQIRLEKVVPTEADRQTFIHMDVRPIYIQQNLCLICESWAAMLPGFAFGWRLMVDRMFCTSFPSQHDLRKR